MVGWYDPLQLVGTGMQALISSQFGAYADRRETMAAVGKPQYHDFSDHGSKEFWADYVADVGDGWDSTFSIASLLAQSEIAIKTRLDDAPTTPTHLTKQGNVLIMGGDQVYPVASKRDYQLRMLNPYSIAFSDAKIHTKPVFAIPGNHDWYDGLSEFEKIYCRGGKIGELQTHQNRSYFALKFPNDWWLYAIDVQLVGSLDAQQLAYFQAISSQHVAIGSKIVVCVAEPSWVYAGEQRSQAPNETLTDFILRCIQGTPGSDLAKKKLACPVVIAGDLHHYARYHCHDKQQHFITAGGGGAFLHPTHNLPATLPIGASSLELQSSFPPKGKSRGLLLGNLLFGIKNWAFCLLISVAYLLFAWLLESSSANFVPASGTDASQESQPLLQTLATIPVTIGNVPAAIATAFEALQYSPMAATLILMMIAGLYAFSDRKGKYRAFVGIWALLHGLAHTFNVVLSIWIFAWINISLLHLEADSLPYVVAFFLELVFISGGAIGGFLMGFYLLVGNWILKAHDNEAFSSLRNRHHKCFLRLKIDDRGLTIYPIGLEKSATRWKQTGSEAMGNLQIAPRKPLAPVLIESPIFIPN